MQVIYCQTGVPFFFYKKINDYVLFVDLNAMNEQKIKELRKVLDRLDLKF